jgi:hypothetical protein
MNINPADILKSFNMSQRLLVLIIMALVISGTYIAVAYLKTDDCSSLAKENLALINTMVETSKLLRQGAVPMDVANTRSMAAESTQDSSMEMRDTSWSDMGLIFPAPMELYETPVTYVAAAKLDSILSIYKK